MKTSVSSAVSLQDHASKLLYIRQTFTLFARKLKMASETSVTNQENESGHMVISDLSDEDIVIKFCLENKISKPAIDELLKRGFTSLEALSLVDVSDLVSPRIPKGQRRLIMHIAGALRSKTTPAVTPGRVLSTEGTANEGPSTNGSLADTPTEILDAAQMTASETSVPVRQTVTANIGVQDNGVHQSSTNNNSSDLYRHINNLIQEQQRLSVSTVVNGNNIQPSQVSWNDPQIHLSSAAGKSTPSYFDICDFVQASVEEEVVLGSQGDQQIVVKSGPKKPRIENITLCQWSVANLAILYKLVGENKLQGPALMDYLSYTTKIYQLVQRFSLVSVMMYDREYRKLQASLNFRWGTDVQHLSNIHLQARDKPAAQGSQQKKAPVPLKPVRHGQGKQEICRNYNSQKGCSFAECKFKHVCIIPGCKQTHSALKHASEK